MGRLKSTCATFVLRRGDQTHVANLGAGGQIRWGHLLSDMP
jgi:hypothetical protein